MILHLWLFVACSSGPAEVGAGAPAEVAALAPPTAECLGEADLVDGAADHVLGRCPNCGFAMEGQAAQASAVGDYTAHSCSESCKKAFDKDPGAVLGRACERHE